MKKYKPQTSSQDTALRITNVNTSPVMAAEKTIQCDNCGQPDPTYPISSYEAMKGLAFCSSECQKEYWSNKDAEAEKQPESPKKQAESNCEHGNKKMEELG